MANATYLRLFPAVKQFELKNGALNVGGRLFVYYEGTDDLAEIRDENGTVLQQPAILDNDGRALGLFVDAQRVYRLVVQDASGAMQFTVCKMAPSGGGAGSAIGNKYDVTSTDGSISVNKFDEGGTTVFDLGLDVDMDRLNPSCLKAGAAPKTGDGKFVFDELVHEGDLLSVDEHGAVRCEPAWYHFTAIVELAYDGTATNTEQQITLYTTLSNSVVDFDLSYAHRESIELSGDIHVVESNSEFVLGVTGLPNGVTASLVDFDIHAITGHEQSTEYTAGNGIDIADHVISADLDVVQHKLTAGQNITITDNVISAENLSQEQADWTQQDSEQPSFIKHKPDLSVYATTSAMETALAGKQDVISDLSTIRSGAAAGATALQPSALDDYSTTQEMNTALAAKQDVISDLSAIRSGAQAGATALQPSALDDYSTTQEMNTALAAKQDVISDLSTIRSGAALGATAVQPAVMNTALAGKQDVISDLATIRSGAALGASSVQPNDLATVATTGDYDDLTDKPDLSIYAESANLATVATTGDYADLNNRPSIPTTTSDLTNDSGFITDADVPVKDVEVDGVSVVNALGTAEIDLSGYATTSAMNTALAGKQDTISDLSTIRSGAALGASSVQPGDLATVATTGDYDDLVNKPSIPAAQVNSDWNASSGVAAILNKPSLAAVATTGDYDDLVNKPSIPAAQVNADWNSSSGVSEILNKPANLVQDANYVHTDENFTSAEKTKLAGIEARAQANVQADWTESDADSDAYIQNKPSLATVATTGAYSDLSGKPTIPTVDQSYNASSTHAQSGVAVAQAIAAAPGTTYTAGDAISIDQDDVISVDYDATTLELGRSYTADQSLSTIDSYYPYALQTNSAVHDWIAHGVPGEVLRIKIPGNMFRFGSSDVRIAIGNSQAGPHASDWCYYTGVNIALIGNGSYTFYVAEQTIEIPLPLSASGWTGNVPTANQFAITFVSIYNGSINEYANNAGAGSLLVAKGAAGGALTVKNPLPASASGDAAKVLTVDSNGDPAWAAPASATVDQTYNASSTNAQSGTAVAGALASYTPTASLATVATTGDYSDLSNTPSIPTATSDLTNDSGFITLSDVPAQVNADWNSSSGASEILNKPTIPSGTQLVPAATSADADKVLTVNAQGVPGWANAQAPISAGDGIDITNNEISVNYDTDTLSTVYGTSSVNMNMPYGRGYFKLPEVIQDLAAGANPSTVTVHIPANTLYILGNFGPRPFPYTTIPLRIILGASDYRPSEEDGEFSQLESVEVACTYDSDNDYTWIDEQDITIPLPCNSQNGWSSDIVATKFTIGADVNYADPYSDILQIRTGMPISNPIVFSYQDASAPQKLAVKNPLPSSTSADEGKCLVVDSNGDPEWGTGGKVYTGTDGVVVDNVNDTVGLEAPVDIVAGPGIVIDNPDGNTLRVSMAQAEEVVLWDNYTFANNKAASVVMTETPFNFSQVRITFYIDATSESWGTLQTQLIDMVALASNTNKFFTLNSAVVNGSDLIVRGSRCRFNKTEIQEHATVQWYNGGIGSMSQSLHIYRIVGIHRIAND